MVELSPGDFLYQSGQELFLVVVEENEDSYRFAVHGWRDIDKDRIEEYVEKDESNVYRQREVEQIIDREGDDEVQQEFNRLKQLFSAYEDAKLPEYGPHTEFSLDE
jgi:hypothetical protein